MRIFNISDFDGLCSTLDQCSPDVQIVTQDDQIFRWGSEKNLVYSLLRSLQAPHIAELGIRGANGADVGRIMSFLYA